jgi:hypothetical protein
MTSVLDRNHTHLVVVANEERGGASDDATAAHSGDLVLELIVKGDLQTSPQTPSEKIFTTETEKVRHRQYNRDRDRIAVIPTAP